MELIVPNTDPYLHRGIHPKLLREQVENTAPFLSIGRTSAPNWLKPLFANFEDSDSFDYGSYFELSLCAHFATVATFVPTDVDSQIRFKLWNPSLPTEVLIQMAKLTLATCEWDFRSVSARWITSPKKQVLSGHYGEWFSVAAGAYGALRKRAPDQAAELAAAILREVQREAEIFSEFKTARDGIGMLKAATLIAHNLGDLDRVIDLWNLPEDDALREAVYKSGHPSVSAKTLLEAGNLNKAFMAVENHRHFALRKPWCLRRNAEFLLPIGPFFDGWGARLARHPELRPEEIGEVAEALVEGWERLKGPVGYARALAGILENFPGGPNELSRHVPARIARTLKSGELRSLCSVSRVRFEEQWKHRALNQ